MLLHPQLSLPFQVPTFRPLCTSLEDDLVGYVLGKKAATEGAHFVWKHVIHKGDTVIDATCGNGYDTLTMLKTVAVESGKGCVYGMDIQRDALDSTSSLVDENVTPKEMIYSLFVVFTWLVVAVNRYCSRYYDVSSKLLQLKNLSNLFPSVTVEWKKLFQKIALLVAFNLGYLPGGDKAITTVPETTLLALEAAKRILLPGGLINLVVYVGHPGGREELGAVENFVSGLSVDDWVCCKFQMLNRPVAPVLIFLFKR